jgi:hypothetical protein
MKRMILLAAVLLAACGSKTAATPPVSTTPTASSTTTPAISPAPIVSPHFVRTPPSAAKVAAAQTDPWVDVVAFHEVGLRAGQTINYQVTGSATASYSCNGRTEVAAGPVGSAKSFTADASGEISEVIGVQPPAPRAGMCTANYPRGIWGFSYQTLHLLDSSNQVGEDVPGMSGGA